jgi:hypothetical protein
VPPGDNGAQDKYVGRILYLKTSIVGDELLICFTTKGLSQTFRKTRLRTNGLTTLILKAIVVLDS